MESLRDSPADLVFLDYILGAETGLDLLKVLRSSGNSSRIVALTGFGDAELARQVTAAGADAYLVKDHGGRIGADPPGRRAAPIQVGAGRPGTRSVTFRELPPPTNEEITAVAWETCRRTRTY